ncbi:MAG: hypothetical protein JSV65_06675 [Armatimonadota bacterium]|nr:MAG: hypothetical protein JSV65_06675 [Armatimonadota bacterium]
MTPRALAIALALCVLLNFLGARSYIMVNRYNGFTDHFNTIGVIFLLFAVTLASALLGRARRRWGLGPGELVVIYSALMVACTVPTMGFGGYIFGITTGPIYFATPENRWSQLLVPLIPGWAAPHQASAVRWVYEGMPAGVSIPWDVWLRPLLWWGLFACAFFLVSIALMVLMRPQWVENERLTYPLTTVPLGLAQSVQGAGLLRSAPMWAGFGLACFLQLYNWLPSAVSALSALPGIPLGKTVTFPNLGFDMVFSVQPLVVGITYLINLDVSLSIWVFYLVTQFEHWSLGRIGLGDTGPGEPHAAGGSALASQQVGALLVLAVASLWMARRFLRRRLTDAWNGGQGGGEVLSQRGMLIAGGIGLAYMIGFLARTGMPLYMVLPYLTLALLVFFGTTRILAQTGVGRLRAPVSPGPMMVNLTGTDAFGARGLAALGLTFVWAGDIQLFVMGTGSHALKTIDDVRLRPRPVFWVMAGALVVSLLTTFIVYLKVGHDHGWLGGYVWYFQMSPRQHWGWVADCLTNPRPPQWTSAGFMALGGAGAGLLSLAHLRFVGWPLHPVGLAISQINTVYWDWSSILLAWLSKGLILRFWGFAGYRRSLPFFLGLILGSCVGSGITVLVDSFR